MRFILNAWRRRHLGPLVLFDCSDVHDEEFDHQEDRGRSEQGRVEDRIQPGRVPVCLHDRRKGGDEDGVGDNPVAAPSIQENHVHEEPTAQIHSHQSKSNGRRNRHVEPSTIGKHHAKVEDGRKEGPGGVQTNTIVEEQTDQKDLLLQI